MLKILVTEYTVTGYFKDKNPIYHILYDNVQVSALGNGSFFVFS